MFCKVLKMPVTIPTRDRARHFDPLIPRRNNKSAKDLGKVVYHHRPPFQNNSCADRKALLLSFVLRFACSSVHSLMQFILLYHFDRPNATPRGILFYANLYRRDFPEPFKRDRFRGPVRRNYVFLTRITLS